MDDVEGHNLVPVPELGVGHAVGATVLLQRRLNQYHVKLCVQLFEIILFKVTFKVHGRMCGPSYQLIFQANKLLQLGIFLKATEQPGVSDKVLWALPGVHKVLAVVVVRVERLGAL